MKNDFKLMKKSDFAVNKVLFNKEKMSMGTFGGSDLPNWVGLQFTFELLRSNQYFPKQMKLNQIN